MSENQEARIRRLESENQALQEEIDQMHLSISRNFGKYLSEDVLKEIMARPVPINEGGVSREVTMMMADLRGSTALSEQMNPMDFIRMLNYFFTEMIDITNAWMGNILEFVGDEMVVVFGAPKPNEKAARDAAACAVAMQRRMSAVNKWNREHQYPELTMGIGIHTGRVILGIIGSQVRAKYDMIGRNVNLTARIEAHAAGGQILVSEDSLQAMGNKAILNPEGEKFIKPKGILGEIHVYDLVGYGSHRLP